MGSRWPLDVAPAEFNHSQAERCMVFCVIYALMRPKHAHSQLPLGYDYAQEQHRPDSPWESSVAASSGAKEWT